MGDRRLGAGWGALSSLPCGGLLARGRVWAWMGWEALRFLLPRRKSREETQPSRDRANGPCPRLKGARVLGTSRRPVPQPSPPLAAPCLGTKLPGWQGHREPETPRPLPGPRPGLCPREKQDHGSFLFRDSSSWNAHPLGFAIFTRPSLPVSMATPPNSRFQAAMTSPFPFLPPRPPGAAALDPISRLLGAPGRAPGAAGRAASPVPCWPGGRAFSGRLPPRGAARLCWSPVAEGQAQGRPSLLLRDPCHAGCPVGAAAGPSGWGGRGRPAPGLAGCRGSRLSGLGSPCGSLIRNW